MNPLALISFTTKYHKWIIWGGVSFVIFLLLCMIITKNNDITRLNQLNEDQLKEITLLSSQITERDAVINELTETNIINQNALITLNQEQRDLLDVLDEQELIIERLKNKNANLKKWADTPLPDDIIRLFNRPKAINNSQDHQKHLSESNALFTTK